jgi:hypothetical protein
MVSNRSWIHHWKKRSCQQYQAALKLSSIIAEAHSNHKSLAVCWLDLANAHGSPHHSPSITTMLLLSSWPSYVTQPLHWAQCQGDWWEGWETSFNSLQNGVHQGESSLCGDLQHRHAHPHPLRIDLGYQFSNSPRRVNILQYADDTCLVSNSPTPCQYLLSVRQTGYSGRAWQPRFLSDNASP